jgi:DNA-binding NtrC family response regulator
VVGRAGVQRADVLIIAATNRLRADGSPAVREDLLGRCEAGRIRTTALGSRRADILPLAFRILTAAGMDPVSVLDTDAAEALVVGDYPRNVRQLQAALAGAALPSHVLARIEHLGIRSRDTMRADSPINGRDAAMKPSREAMQRLLEVHGGSVGRLAGVLGFDRSTVYAWLKEYGLKLRRAP